MLVRQIAISTLQSFLSWISFVPASRLAGTAATGVRSGQRVVCAHDGIEIGIIGNDCMIHT